MYQKFPFLNIGDESEVVEAADKLEKKPDCRQPSYLCSSPPYAVLLGFT